MSVSSISSNNPYVSPFQPASQTKQDFFSLSTALSSGDLAGAQKAFGSLQQDLQNSGISAQMLQSGTTGQDFQALQKALASGDLSAAKNAFNTLTQDLQQAKGHHHHHHHHKDAQQNTTDSSATNGINGSNSSTSGNINVTA
jgi:hypothetical protein